MASPPHFVVIPLPVYGHIFPMLHLSVQLASIGNKITFIASSRTKTTTLSTFESSLSQIQDPQTVRTNLIFEFLSGDELLQQGGEQGFRASLDWMVSQITAVDEAIESCVSRHGPVSCVILDFMVFFLKNAAADKRNATVAALWTASAPWMLLSLQIQALIDGGYVPLTPSNALSVVSGLTGVPPLCNYKDVPVCLLKPATDQQIEEIAVVSKMFLEVPWLLVNTIPELDSRSLRYVRELGVKSVAIGPLLPLPVKDSCRAPDDVPVLSWLDQKPPQSVVFICFGTLAENTLEQLQELASALEELTNQSFLWVLRPSQQSCLSEDFKRRTAARGKIVPWCSQLQVLSHPSIGGFVTHCGWNSILESLSCGVPMLGWPCLGEQSLNSKYLADVWKAGTRIVPYNPDGSNRVVNRSEVSKEIALLMTGEEGQELRNRAREIQKASTRAMQSSVDELRRWVAQLFHQGEASVEEQV
ncbi:anthocyanidin 3-O-glucosyltransferase 2 [Selaginella moellendorffii]|nr:anthocyanidin 3-O-glucosyltransferase 2 [Selaginella moellendorffii]|eukprot:XP_002986175.2 anthocyanidin 3-O-glucosyltransferase 2 [Selaginella moellendorffii]